MEVRRGDVCYVDLFQTPPLKCRVISYGYGTDHWGEKTHNPNMVKIELIEGSGPWKKGEVLEKFKHDVFPLESLYVKDGFYRIRNYKYEKDIDQ